MKKETVFIEGMSCPHCVKAVEDSVNVLDGIISVKIELKERKADIIFEEEKISLVKIEAAIEEEGYSIRK